MADDFATLAARLGASGCTPEEIARVEADQAVTLPVVYREFLRTMGRDAGGLMAGTSIIYSEILGARQAAVELLEENQVPPSVLPARATVIYLHQGYIFGFLDPDEAEDPPVREWAEGQADELASTVLAAGFLPFMLAGLPHSADQIRSCRATRNMRKPAHEREDCPRCGRPMQWHGAMSHSSALPADVNGRAGAIAECTTCRSRFWRWADEWESPLTASRPPWEQDRSVPQ